MKKLSHFFLAFFERIHGKIYMRKIKQKKGVNVDENNRFEQLSLFELCMGDDESSGGSETSEGKKQSIIYHFEGEESRAVEQSGISTLSGNQFTLHAGTELSWMEKLQKKEQLLNQAREITWQWVQNLKVLQTKYWREYI